MKSLSFTRTVQAVLFTMATNHKREMYGREICQATSIRPGTAYPILLRMLNAGWVEDRWEMDSEKSHGRPPRHYYRLRPSAVREIQQMLSWTNENVYRMPGLDEALTEAVDREE